MSSLLERIGHLENAMLPTGPVALGTIVDRIQTSLQHHRIDDWESTITKIDKISHQIAMGKLDINQTNDIILSSEHAIRNLDSKWKEFQELEHVLTGMKIDEKEEKQIDELEIQIRELFIQSNAKHKHIVSLVDEYSKIIEQVSEKFINYEAKCDYLEEKIALREKQPQNSN